VSKEIHYEYSSQQETYHYLKYFQPYCSHHFLKFGSWYCNGDMVVKSVRVRNQLHSESKIKLNDCHANNNRCNACAKNGWILHLILKLADRNI
jgi:hypothetical protein